jgi:hypothetical protein
MVPDSDITMATTPLAHPTFSWIACPGPIHYGQNNFQPISFSFRPNRFPPISSGPPAEPDFTALCYLESFDVELATSDPYGQIKYAAIHLQGHFVLVSDLLQLLEGTGQKMIIMILDSGLVYSWSEFSDVGDFQDHMGSAAQWDSIVCLTLSKTNRMTVALLLQPETDAPVYKRIGIMWDMDQKWLMEDGFERTFTVV